LLVFLTSSMQSSDSCVPTSPTTTPPPPLACANCANSLVALTGVLPPTYNDEYLLTNGCLEWVMDCGPDATGTWTVNGDPANTVFGPGTIFLECDTDGLSWYEFYSGVTTTQIACSVPPCVQCAQTQIARPGAAWEDLTFHDYSSGCDQWSLLCNSATSTILLNGGAVPPIGPTAFAELVVTCDATGTAWVDGAGNTITSAECVPPPACQMCPESLITQLGSTFEDTTQHNIVGGCDQWSLSCTVTAISRIILNGGTVTGIP
ncbi:hypothetical protein PENTCL1PPCAC_3892, partial [Pristionchus entomophagus]